MFSGDPDIHRDIDVTLNLNNMRLKTERKRIYDVLLTRLKAKGGTREHWPPTMILQELEAWRQRDSEGRLPEYCQVAIYILDKKLPHGRADLR